MSVQAMSRVMESSQTTGMTRLVLLVIANHETEERGAFPSVDRIAKEARCSERAVQDAIGRAKALGEIEVQLRAGPQGTNIYRVLVGLRASAPLPGMEVPTSAGVQNLRGADSRRTSAPERKELGVRGRSTASSSSQLTSGFAEFYEAFPRHMKPRDAEMAYKAALRRTDHASIMAAVRRMVADPNLPAKEHIPYPASWLRADGWLNEAYAPHTNGDGSSPAAVPSYLRRAADEEAERAALAEMGITL